MKKGRQHESNVGPFIWKHPITTTTAASTVKSTNPFKDSAHHMFLRLNDLQYLPYPDTTLCLYPTAVDIVEPRIGNQPIHAYIDSSTHRQMYLQIY